MAPLASQMQISLFHKQVVIFFSPDKTTLIDVQKSHESQEVA